MTSADGHEMQFATNHLGHFLLIKELLDVLLATAAREHSPGRVVVLSSAAHFMTYNSAKGGPVRLDDIDAQDGYEPWLAYGQSKLCNILFVRELNNRLKGQPIVAVACHPGAIPTELSRNLTMPKVVVTALSMVFRPFMKSIPQGAATQVFLATAADVRASEYYADCNVNPSSTASHNADLGSKVWGLSEKLVVQ